MLTWCRENTAKHSIPSLRFICLCFYYILFGNVCPCWPRKSSTSGFTSPSVSSYISGCSRPFLGTRKPLPVSSTSAEQNTGFMVVMLLWVCFWKVVNLVEKFFLWRWSHSSGWFWTRIIFLHPTGETLFIKHHTESMMYSLPHGDPGIVIFCRESKTILSPLLLNLWLIMGSQKLLILCFWTL